MPLVQKECTCVQGGWFLCCFYKSDQCFYQEGKLRCNIQPRYKLNHCQNCHWPNKLESWALELQGWGEAVWTSVQLHDTLEGVVCCYTLKLNLRNSSAIMDMQISCWHLYQNKKCLSVFLLTVVNFFTLLNCPLFHYMSSVGWSGAYRLRTVPQGLYFKNLSSSLTLHLARQSVIWYHKLRMMKELPDLGCKPKPSVSGMTKMLWRKALKLLPVTS